MPEKRLRIMVVDDHEVVRKGVRTILASHEKVEVCGEASNGEEAIRKALELNPDLVILDVTMPVMDGLSAAREIKRWLPAVPILMLSMHDGPEIIRASREAGVQGFVTKSEVAGVLLRAVDAIFEGQTFFSEGGKLLDGAQGKTSLSSRP